MFCRLGQEGREGLPYSSFADLDVTYDECTIDRIAFSDLTEQKFKLDYFDKQRPFMLTGVPEALRWPAAKQWTSFEAFASEHAAFPVQFLQQAMSLGSAVKRIRQMQTEKAAVALTAVHSIVAAPLSYLSSVRRAYASLPSVVNEGNLYPMFVSAMNSMRMWNETFSHA